MPAAKITSKGQITLPKEIRDALGLRAGDRVTFVVREDGTAVMYPRKGSLDQLFARVKPEKQGVSLDDMQEAIEARDIE